MADDLVIPGTQRVLAIAAAEQPAPEDLDGWDIGERILTSPARGWLIGRYLHTGMPPNSNGHVFRHEHIARLHPTITHTPFDMLHDPRRIVGHYAATKLVTPTAGAAAGYTDTPYVKALACVYSYNFPDDFREIQAAYEQGLAFMSMSCRPQSVTCPTCGHNAPWLGYTNDAYCSHMQGRNPKWMEMPLFVGGAAIVPPTRPGWKNASVTRIAAFMDANQELTADIFEHLHRLAPSAAASDLEAMTAQLLAIAFGPDATELERTAKIAPLWAGLTADHPDVDLTPPADVQAAAKPALAADPITATRAAALAAGDLITPDGIRNLVAALTSGDLVAVDALGGATTLTWAQAVLEALDDTPTFTGSGMLALYPADPEALVVEGGAAADTMHVTIAYLGKDDEITPQAYEIAGSFGLAALASRPVIEATISGVGTLGTEGAVVVFMQGPGLTEAYDDTWAVLDASGQTYHQRHPSFIAHCTLGYADTPEAKLALFAAGDQMIGTKVVLDKAGYDAPGDAPPELLTLGAQE